MSKKINSTDQLQAIQELKELFRFGGEIIPYLEELFIFLRDIMPMLEGVNSSLKETALHMPKAQDRISEASRETEAATKKIMDKLDTINQRLSHLSEKVNINDCDPEIPNTIEEMRNDTFDIIYALQFQDITSQQLVHAQKILNAVSDRYQSLVDAIEKISLNDSLRNLLKSRLKNDVEIKEDNLDTMTEDTIRNRGITQADIDKLFEN